MLQRNKNQKINVKKVVHFKLTDVVVLKSNIPYNEQSKRLEGELDYPPAMRSMRFVIDSFHYDNYCGYGWLAEASMMLSTGEINEKARFHIPLKDLELFDIDNMKAGEIEINVNACAYVAKDQTKQTTTPTYEIKGVGKKVC